MPYGMPVTKVNGNMHYRLSDLHFPRQHMPPQNTAQPDSAQEDSAQQDSAEHDSAQQDTAQRNQAKKKVFKRKWGQCYTIIPDEAIRERIDQLDANSGLKVD